MARTGRARRRLGSRRFAAVAWALGALVFAVAVVVLRQKGLAESLALGVYNVLQQLSDRFGVNSASLVLATGYVVWVAVALHRAALAAASLLSRSVHGKGQALLGEDVSISPVSDEEVVSGFLAHVLPRLWLPLLGGVVLLWALCLANKDLAWNLLYDPVFGTSQSLLHDPIPWLSLLVSSILASTAFTLLMVLVGRLLTGIGPAAAAVVATIGQLAYPVLAFKAVDICGWQGLPWPGVMLFFAFLVMSAFLMVNSTMAQGKDRLSYDAVPACFCAASFCAAYTMLVYAYAFRHAQSASWEWAQALLPNVLPNLTWCLGTLALLNPYAMHPYYYSGGDLVRLALTSVPAWILEMFRYTIFLLMQLLIIVLLARAARLAVMRRRQEW